MANKVLVLGSTGRVGYALVEALTSLGVRVRAASRSGKEVAGAEGVRFDYLDAQSISSALDGVDAVFAMAPTGTLDSVGLLSPLIAATTARRVKVVLMTAIGVEADERIPYRQVELSLERSGSPFVLLRPNWFADNFHSYWHAGVQQGVIRVPAADGKSSFIDTRDIAASAAAALVDSRFDGGAFTLTGPEALGYDDAAAILSRVIGRTIRYESIDDDTFVRQLASVGVPEVFARFLASIFHPVRQGWTAAPTDAVRTLTGRAPRSVERYALDNLSVLRATG